MTDHEQELTRRIQQVLAETFKLPEAQVTAELQFGDLPQWDSMGHMEVMMRLEEHFGVDINADTIAALTSVAAIRDHILHRNHTEASHE